MFKRFNPEENFYNKEKEEADNSQEESNKISRREFLKQSGLAIGAMMAGGRFFENNNIIREWINSAINQVEEIPESDLLNKEQEQEEEESKEFVAEPLEFSLYKKTKLDAEIIKSAQNYWEKEYKENPRLKRDLDKGLKRMEKYAPLLEKIFENEGIPSKYAYIAIVESYFNLKSNSRKKAKGPYQFMKKTARAFGLKVGRLIDERLDPIKSGKAAAKLLNYLYKRTKDYDLALSGYNGGFIWLYLKQCAKKDKEPCYEDFIAFMSEKVDKTKKQVKTLGHITHKVARGENLNDILKKYSKYKINKWDLLNINKIEDENLIFAGQRLKIPVNNAIKEKVFQRRINGVRENLNYVPRVNAVLNVIKERKGAKKET